MAPVERGRILGRAAAIILERNDELARTWNTLRAPLRSDDAPVMGATYGTPAIVETMSKDSKDFYLQVSSERADEFKDVDVAVTYAPADLLGKVQADPLLAQIPAVKKGAVAILPDATPLAASANPSPLSIKKTLPDYLKALSEALKKNV